MPVWFGFTLVVPVVMMSVAFFFESGFRACHTDVGGPTLVLFRSDSDVINRRLADVNNVYTAIINTINFDVL